MKVPAHQKDYPFSLKDGDYCVSIETGKWSFNTVRAYLNIGDGPDYYSSYHPNEMCEPGLYNVNVYSSNTRVNLTDPSDQTIHSFEHFLERIDDAFRRVKKNIEKAYENNKEIYEDEGFVLAEYECPSSENMYMSGTNFDKKCKNPVYVLLSDWVVEQLGFDKHKLIKVRKNWYMVRNIEYKPLHKDIDKYMPYR